MQTQSPSLLRVISTDYTSFLSVFFPVVFGGFSIYFYFAGTDALRIFLPIAVGAVLVGIPVLIRRYRMISRVFSDGIQVKGVITGIGFFRGRGHVEYSYTVDGAKQTSGNAIYKNGRTRKLRIGAKVTVVVDRNNPGQAFIREIYL